MEQMQPRYGITEGFETLKQLDQLNQAEIRHHR